MKNKLPNIFLKTAKMCGMDHLAKDEKAHFYLQKDEVISYKAPEGVEMIANQIQDGIEAKIIVKQGVKIKESLFFCFGLEGEKERQLIIPKIIIEDDAEVCIVAHCSFPNAVDVSHEMEGSFKIGKRSKFFYKEAHYHGKNSGARVLPKLRVSIDKEGFFKGDFALTRGTIGKLKIEVGAILKEKAKMELETKVFGQSKRDSIKIIDKVFLKGEGSKSLIKMRAAAKDGGKVLMQGETYAQATGAVGHVDCQEIVIGDNSVAKAVPIVEVSNEGASVTHEASVGKINQKELETLMTRGLDEEEATELIVEAMMR